MAYGILALAGGLAGLTILANVAASFSAGASLIAVALVSVLTPVLWVIVCLTACYVAAKVIEMFYNRSQVKTYRRNEAIRQAQIGLSKNSPYPLPERSKLHFESERIDEVSR